MPVNHYFHSGVPMGRRSEQNLYEDLIIESLKIYGHETYYIPRKKFNQDTIFTEDALQSYEHAYQIEMYMENVQGFEGEGEVLSKFGIEIRDSATFVVSRRRWKQLVGNNNTTILPRPAEGDIIYFPLTRSFFEIRKVIGDQPFYQAGALHTFKLNCELMQYSLEEFDTGIGEIDEIADAQQDMLLTDGYRLEAEDGSILITETGETLMQENWDSSGYTVSGTTIKDNMNMNFDTDIDDILDFTERNPFGEVANA